ncbi:MAG: porin family protein [Bacteroidetes bacterium]|nr:porin family protein [Bacteroidota bacterium]
MKKIILTVAAVFAFSFANAQDKKGGSEGFSQGDLYLTGTANLTNSKTGDVKSDGLTLAPGVGYFLTENIALEGSLSFKSGKDTNAAGVETKTSGFGIAAGAKYLFTPADKFSLSIGGNISYMSTKVEVGGGDATTKEIGINVPVGLNYFVSSNFALTSTWGGLGYSSNDNGGKGADKTNKFGLGLDMSSISFGLLYKL